jgi:uncharacterized RDD family membrane protein YckC
MRANYEKRFLAYVFDVIIAFLVAFGSILYLNLTLPFFIFFLYFLTAVQIYAIVFYFIYILGALFLFGGVSIGGMIFNVKVLDNSLKPLSFTKALIRALLQSLLPLAIFNIAYMLINRTQTSVFDAATDTRTVKIRNRE